MENQNCQNCKQDFNIEPDDLAFYEQIQVPAPTWCPLCRLLRRTIWRNERTLYKRDCDLCHKPAIGMYHPDVPLKVYCRDCWYSDDWDPFSFAQQYDFSKPFFEQWRELLQNVPRCSLVGSKNVDSPYANFSLANSNVYLSFASHYNEQSAYLQYSNRCKNSYDCLHVGNSERVIDCNYSDRLNNCAGLQYSNACTECILGYDLRNCLNCFGCVSQRGKSNMIFNEQYDRAGYQEKLDEILKDRNSFEEAAKTFEDLKKRMPKRGTYQQKCVDSTGSDLEECKDVHDSFGVKYAEDCRYLFVNCINVKSSMDMNNIASDPCEFLYEAQGATNSSNAKCIDTSWDNTFIEYSNLCFSSNNLFGCIGLRKKEFCILNRQYEKEEYLEMIGRIKSHMQEMPYADGAGKIYGYGEFFPPEFSPFRYNETISALYFPLTEQEILDRGYGYREVQERKYVPTKDRDTLPSLPEEFDASLSSEIIECSHKGGCADQCTLAFKLLPDEIALYKSLRIPLPTECPNCRNMSRVRARGGMELRETACSCENAAHGHDAPCGIPMLTNLSPDPADNPYCESCYQQEML